jgi:hypothetical protein
MAARVRSRHSEPGNDLAAYQLAVWALDLAALAGSVQGWAETVTTTTYDEDQAELDYAQAGADLLSAWRTYLHSIDKHQQCRTGEDISVDLSAVPHA